MFCVVKVLPHLTTIVQPDVSDFGQTNGRDQQIAANGLSTPQEVIAILLHRLVRRPGHPSTPLDSPIANERRR